jgi:hypothetical protein
MSFRASWASCGRKSAQRWRRWNGILAAARSDDTLGFTWPEVDTEKKVWVVPAARMKAEADHRVPLSDRMLEILEKLDRDTVFVFSGQNPKKKLPHETMLKVLKDKQGVFACYPIEKGKDETRVAVLDFDDHDNEVEWPRCAVPASSPYLRQNRDADGMKPVSSN